MNFQHDVIKDVGEIRFRNGHGEVLTVAQGLGPPKLSNGWRAFRVFSGFSGFLMLELVHQGGQRATWILDQSAVMIANTIANLPEAWAAKFQQCATEVLSKVIDQFVGAPEVARDPMVIGFFDLDNNTRADIRRIVGSLGVQQIAAVPLETMSDRIGVDHQTVSTAAIRSLLDLELHGVYWAACKQSRISWPSPIDGAEIFDSHSLVISTLLVAWRCVDRRHGLVFYVLAAGFRQKVAALFIPRDGLFVTKSRSDLGRIDVKPAEILKWINEHYFEFGLELLTYLIKAPTRYAHFTWPNGAAHIGHYLWNELSGLEAISENLNPIDYPLIFDLGGAGGSAFYGPLALLYPELRHVISHHFNTIPAMLSRCYRAGIQVLRFSGDYISAEIRNRIANIISMTPASETARASLWGEMGPVIVFGLRVENRTITKLADFYILLARTLVVDLGSFTVIIDGHNSRGGEQTHASFLEHRATRRPIDVEREIVRQIKLGLADLPVKIVDCVGLVMLDNLAWLSNAHLCVSPWGAGLAKYRWIANLPTWCAISNFNRRHKNDIHIYSAADWLEGAELFIFCRPELVTDRPDDAVLVQMDTQHIPYYTNYDIDVRGAAADIVAFLAKVAGATTIWSRKRPHSSFNLQGDVLLGAEGQLFLSSGGHGVLDHVLGYRRPLLSSLRNFDRNIVRRAEVASALGSKYRHVVFPDKHSVMETQFGVTAEVRLLDIYRDRCPGAWAHVVDPTPALRSLGQAAYLRTDTHLTHRGTLVVAGEMLHALFGADAKELVDILEALPEREMEYCGDLGGKLAPQHTETRKVFIFDNSIVHTSNKQNTGNNGSATVYFNSKAFRSEKILMFGDSFGSDLVWLIANIFRDAIFLRTPYLHEELVTEIRPDIVITGNVERYLSYVESDEARPIFHQMSAIAHAETQEQRDFAETFSDLLSAGRVPARVLRDRRMLQALTIAR